MKLEWRYLVAVPGSGQKGGEPLRLLWVHGKTEMINKRASRSLPQLRGSAPWRLRPRRRSALIRQVQLQAARPSEGIDWHRGQSVTVIELSQRRTPVD
jgi:hypothetical protein